MNSAPLPNVRSVVSLLDEAYHHKVVELWKEISRRFGIRDRNQEALPDFHEAFPFEFKSKPLGGWMQVVIADESELDDLMEYVRQSYEAALAKA